MSDTIRGKVVIAEAGEPDHPATVVQRVSVLNRGAADPAPAPGPS